MLSPSPSDSDCAANKVSGVSNIRETVRFSNGNQIRERAIPKGRRFNFLKGHAVHLTVDVRVRLPSESPDWVLEVPAKYLW